MSNIYWRYMSNKHTSIHICCCSPKAIQYISTFKTNSNADFVRSAYEGRRMQQWEETETEKLGKMCLFKKKYHKGKGGLGVVVEGYLVGRRLKCAQSCWSKSGVRESGWKESLSLLRTSLYTSTFFLCCLLLLLLLGSAILLLQLSLSSITVWNWNWNIQCCYLI